MWIIECELLIIFKSLIFFHCLSIEPEIHRLLTFMAMPCEEGDKKVTQEYLVKKVFIFRVNSERFYSSVDFNKNVINDFAANK